MNRPSTSQVSIYIIINFLHLYCAHCRRQENELLRFSRKFMVPHRKKKVIPLKKVSLGINRPSTSQVSIYINFLHLYCARCCRQENELLRFSRPSKELTSAAKLLLLLQPSRPLRPTRKRLTMSRRIAVRSINSSSIAHTKS